MHRSVTFLGLRDRVAEQALVTRDEMAIHHPQRQRRPIAIAREHRFSVAAVSLLILLLAAGAAYGLYAYLHSRSHFQFQNFAISQATNNGITVGTGISPDGKFLLNIQRENGQHSLRLRNILTASDTEVISATGRDFASPGFSRDGNYIYFRESQSASSTVFDLYRAPVLGGLVVS